ncbi:MAG: diaminopimelate epimerase [Methanomicrobiales archaeon]|nr:diaminopimelate epimerase [Methanomicrobiales archaeon]
MEISFSKMQENGNDFILVDEFEQTVIPDDMKAQFAAIYCDRRFGIGAEGVIYLMQSQKNVLRMRLYLPDEREAETPHTGIRCLAKYALDAGYVRETCTVGTAAGETAVSMRYEDQEFLARITLPQPKYERKDITATGSGEFREKIAGFEVHAVTIDAPHAVIIVDAVDAVDLDAAGPAICHHASFPEAISVSFVERNGRDSIRIRTFDHAAEGETLSCGTGAAASAVIVHKLGLCENVVEVETRGGSLTVSISDNVTMEGPATTVFSGHITF